jgi:hypothetical protein
MSPKSVLRPAAPPEQNFQISTMTGSRDDTFSKLHITQAYIKLLCLPESEFGGRMISLERIGNYEIRIFEPSQTESDEAPLFWMELFDHDSQSSIDSCSCYEIEEAATAFESFILQAKRPGECCSPEA